MQFLMDLRLVAFLYLVKVTSGNVMKCNKVMRSWILLSCKILLKMLIYCYQLPYAVPFYVTTLLDKTRYPKYFVSFYIQYLSNDLDSIYMLVINIYITVRQLYYVMRQENRYKLSLIAVIYLTHSITHKQWLDTYAMFGQITIVHAK